MNYSFSETDLSIALNTLKNGGVILYPTDTIWGIGCDATNVQAIEKIFHIKQRDREKNTILLVSDTRMLYKYVKEIPPPALDIIENSNKPTTIVYDQALNLPKQIIAADGSIAIRVCRDEFCNRLINKLNKPLVSTSANISGEKTPENFIGISQAIKKQVDYTVQHKQNNADSASASSIIKIQNNGLVKIIRP